MDDNGIPGPEPKLGFPNVAGLRALIGEIKSEDLTLVPGADDPKIYMLKRQIERVTANRAEKDRLKLDFDHKVADLIESTIEALPSEKDLYKRGLSGIQIVNLKTMALQVLRGIPNLPLFCEEVRPVLTMRVRRLLEQKQLIGPSTME